MSRSNGPGDLPAAHEERWHDPEDDPHWQERWGFDFVDGSGALAGCVVVTRLPASRTWWYEAVLVGPGRAPVSVVARDLRAPTRHGSLELRGDGVWADHNRETPWRHWSVGLEAFGVRLDDPADGFAPDPRGDRVGLAFDLEWECPATLVPGGEGPGLPLGGGYEQVAEVHGEVLVGPEVLEVDGWGRRDHWWGRWDPADVSWGRELIRAADGSTHRRHHGRPPLAPDGTVPPVVELDGWPTQAEVVAWVASTLGGGSRANRVVRALCLSEGTSARGAEEAATSWVEAGVPAPGVAG